VRKRAIIKDTAEDKYRKALLSKAVGTLNMTKWRKVRPNWSGSFSTRKRTAWLSVNDNCTVSRVRVTSSMDSAMIRQALYKMQ
jgi:hypothetical protein